MTFSRDAWTELQDAYGWENRLELMPARMAVGYIFKHIMDSLPGDQNRKARLSILELLGDEEAGEILRNERRESILAADIDIG